MLHSIFQFDLFILGEEGPFKSAQHPHAPCAACSIMAAMGRILGSPEESGGEKFIW